jgi:hypothetical protein
LGARAVHLGHRVPDAGTELRPSAAALEAGATPGFRLARSSEGSVVGQYRHLANNFLLGTYNVDGGHLYI